MESHALADFLLKNYGDRSKFPEDEEQLYALLDLSYTVIHALRAECAELERVVPSTAINKKFKKKQKK